jgi:hypothetical protein
VGGYLSAASESDNRLPPDPGPSSERSGQRRKLACIECRRRKIKCDREHPCLSCILVRLPVGRSPSVTYTPSRADVSASCQAQDRPGGQDAGTTTNSTIDLLVLRPF